MAPRKGDDGAYNFFMPQGFTQSELSLVDIAQDYGLFVQKVLENGEGLQGTTVPAVSDQISAQKFLDIMSEGQSHTLQ
jgi:hypothetical protein